MKKYFHPLLAAIFPVLFFYSYNQNQLNPKILYLPLVMSLVFSFIFWILFCLILMSLSRGSLFTTIFLIWFFVYGRITYLFRNIFIPIGSHIVGPDKIFFPLSIVLIVFIFFKFLKSKKSFIHINNFLNFFFTILTLFQLLTIIPREQKISHIQNTNPAISSSSLSSFPDIYFIILDAYARSDVLGDIYNYDNSWFLNDLADLGFTVLKDSRSNYAQTFFSLASALNMKHLTYLTQSLGKSSTDVSIPLNLISQSQVVGIFKQMGYQIINFPSGWGPTDNLDSADINYDAQSIKIFGNSIPVNEFSIVFLKTTALSPFIKNVLSDQARAKILYAFDKLVDLPFQRQKKFVIAHFNSPHPPYLFDQDGNLVPDQVLEMAGESFCDQKNYLNQLIFISQKIDQILKKIIENSQTPPLIILISDHGPASLLGHPYSWPRPAPKQGVRERMSNLVAYYLPSRVDQGYVPKTPVNIFPFIFNNYFETIYSYLPETSYFSDYHATYEFFELKNDQ